MHLIYVLRPGWSTVGIETFGRYPSLNPAAGHSLWYASQVKLLDTLRSSAVFQK